MNLGNGRKEMQKKPIENRNAPLVIPKSNEINFSNAIQRVHSDLLRRKKKND